jgi:hypothetical protein
MTDQSLETLRALCRDLDPEPAAARAMRYLEVWSPPFGEAVVAGMVAQDLRDAGAHEVTLDEEFEGSPSVIAWLRGTEPGPTIQWHGHLDAIATQHTPARR